MVFQVLFRGVRRMQFFTKNRDDEAFEKITVRILLSRRMHICWCSLM